MKSSHSKSRRSVLGRGFIASSDKLNIAKIGDCGKGYSDMMNAWNNGATIVAAICDVDWNMAKREYREGWSL